MRADKNYREISVYFICSPSAAQLFAFVRFYYIQIHFLGVKDGSTESSV